MPSVTSRPPQAVALVATATGKSAATATQPFFGDIQRALFSAIRKGDIASIKQFLKTGK
jgi:hypothetical protein